MAAGFKSTACAVAAVLMASGVTGCATTAPSLAASSAGASATGGGGGGGGRVINAVASINAWGSILAQLGGTHVHTTSIISNPATDPHDYEPTPADGRSIATARLLVENGVGYDSWAAKAAAANPDPARTVIDVGTLTGTPAGGNPHRWYSPADVDKVVNAITTDLKKADPADAGYFNTQRTAFQTTGLGEYHKVIAGIKTRYAGTPVGASESIFTPLAQALGLKLLTPPGFLKNISEGTDPSASDKATIDAQINSRRIKVYVFNAQNSTPDVSAQVQAAHAAGIPVVKVTETLAPKGATFQAWQVAQLTNIETALAKSSGK